jgi:RNA polymerase sigma-70 factor, ECF subfamily
VEPIEAISTEARSPDDLYAEAMSQFGPSLDRLTRAYEADPEKRRDLSQDIQLQLWRSFRNYDRRCSLRTWTYRIAHHVAASHVIRETRTFSALVSLEELVALPDRHQGEVAAEKQINLNRLFFLIQRLKPLDRQVIVSWLEGMDAESIGEITGLTSGAVAVRVNRIKEILTHRFVQRGTYAG